jgi:hypothetical protein
VQFKGLLVETEKIHMASSWEDARELIQDDPRWSRVPDDSERKKLYARVSCVRCVRCVVSCGVSCVVSCRADGGVCRFLEHVRELHERATQDFLMLLDETNKETMAISATTTVADWPKIEHLVRVRRLEAAFLFSFSHPPPTDTCAFVLCCVCVVLWSCGAVVVVKGDKRYRAFSVRPEERVRLLEAYIAGDRPKTAEDKRVASV